MAGPTCTIECYQGDWVWIRDDFGHEGWAKRSDVVPVDLAIDHFTKQIQDQPKKGGAYFLRAWVWREKGDLDMALADMSEAIRLSPADGWYFNSRAIIYNDKGDHQLAVTDYNAALRQLPNETTIWKNAARCRHNMKEYDKAIRNATRAIELEPTDEGAYYVRGESWHMKGDDARALLDFQKAIRFKPSYVSAYKMSVKILAASKDRKLRDGKKALELAQRACELTEWKDATCIHNLGASYAQNGDFENAIKYSTQAFEMATGEAKELIGKRLELFRAGEW